MDWPYLDVAGAEEKVETLQEDQGKCAQLALPGVLEKP